MLIEYNNCLNTVNFLGHCVLYDAIISCVGNVESIVDPHCFCSLIRIVCLCILMQAQAFFIVDRNVKHLITTFKSRDHAV